MLLFVVKQKIKIALKEVKTYIDQKEPLIFGQNSPKIVIKLEELEEIIQKCFSAQIYVTKELKSF